MLTQNEFREDGHVLVTRAKIVEELYATSRALNRGDEKIVVASILRWEAIWKADMNQGKIPGAPFLDMDNIDPDAAWLAQDQATSFADRLLSVLNLNLSTEQRVGITTLAQKHGIADFPSREDILRIYGEPSSATPVP